MSGKVLELERMLGDASDSLAEQISNKWTKWYSQRNTWLQEKQEIRNYVFATDTTTTTNSSLPWKNKTTLPKLCQIRDNLHSNYLSALFPNDNWLRWEGYSPSDEEKRNIIEWYMDNKIRQSNFRTEMSKLLLDYIDYGNAFASVEYINEEVTRPEVAGVATIPGFVGPRAKRIDPKDIVFNPTAPTFEQSPKIIRAILSEGEFKQMAQDEPENAMLAEAILKRDEFKRQLGAYSREDAEKANGYSMDGFGNLYDYYEQPYVEILTFYGDYNDSQSGVFKRHRKVTIVDRMFVIADEEIPLWSMHAPIYHVGWRMRQDNLYAMGPLDNLVGMQYRIDHLENLRADVFDLIAFPPLKVKGDVEEFVWGPMEQIYMNGDGDVEMMAPDSKALAADMQIQLLEQKMEEYAGAPREAMGMRTPGEKTAFEVSSLQNAASRIFQEKITHFEVEMEEKLLNAMLLSAREQDDVSDYVRVFDEDLGVATFRTVTRQDITARGQLRPIGARHFAQDAQNIQNLTNLANTRVWATISPHVSGKALARLVERSMNLDQNDIISNNAAVFEQQELQQLVSQASQETEEVNNTDVTGLGELQ